MTARFVPPTPNCGHVEGVTFTFYVLGALWLCAGCDSSIGLLGAVKCNRCGRRPSAGTQLVDVFRAGRLCPKCRRDFLAGIRPS